MTSKYVILKPKTRETSLDAPTHLYVHEYQFVTVVEHSAEKVYQAVDAHVGLDNDVIKKFMGCGEAVQQQQQHKEGLAQPGQMRVTYGRK